jgi:hypothetical protein
MSVKAGNFGYDRGPFNQSENGPGVFHSDLRVMV